MNLESGKRSWRPRRLLMLLTLIVVAAPVVVANLNHDARPPSTEIWPPPNPADGWPLIWYWRQMKPDSVLPAEAADCMHALYGTTSRPVLNFQAAGVNVMFCPPE